MVAPLFGDSGLVASVLEGADNCEIACGRCDVWPVTFVTGVTLQARRNEGGNTEKQDPDRN